VIDLYVTQLLSLEETAERLDLSNKALRDFMDTHNLERRDNSVELDSQDIADSYIGPLFRAVSTRPTPNAGPV